MWAYVYKNTLQFRGFSVIIIGNCLISSKIWRHGVCSHLTALEEVLDMPDT